MRPSITPHLEPFQAVAPAEPRSAKPGIEPPTTRAAGRACHTTTDRCTATSGPPQYWHRGPAAAHQRPPDRGDAAIDRDHQCGIHSELLGWIGFGEHICDLRSIIERHRLVVADDREVVRQLHQLSLAANCVEDGLPAYPRGSRDGVDGGTGVATVGEESSRGIDDPLPGL